MSYRRISPILRKYPKYRRISPGNIINIGAYLLNIGAYLLFLGNILNIGAYLLEIS